MDAPIAAIKAIIPCHYEVLMDLSDSVFMRFVYIKQEVSRLNLYSVVEDSVKEGTNLFLNSIRKAI
jgi:hypothetical protein